MASVGSGKAQQDWLNDAANMDGARTDGYKLYADFYDGLNGAKLRDRARKYLWRWGVPFCENFCDLAVDVVAERLNVIGFASTAATTKLDAEGKEITDDPYAQLAEEWWAANRMDAAQMIVHTQTLMKGDGFVIVEWDEDRGAPRFCQQLQSDMKVVYSDDAPDMMLYACKVWNTTKVGPQNPKGRIVRRLNVFYPERVEKWYRPDSGGSGGIWEHWQDEEDSAWPVTWTTDLTAEGEPLGIPVVHFRHRPLNGGYGRSRVRPAIPFQEQLNKYVADLNDLVDNHALPQDWVTGVPDNISVKRVAGDVWHAVAENAKFGRLDASPTGNLLEAIEGVLSRLARRSRIPMHLLTGGTPPSGESLKTAESGLISVVRGCQVEFGNSWEDVIGLGLRLASAFGDVDVPDGVTVEAQWSNPETRSDKADLEAAALKKALGISKHTIIRELGYDPEKEQEWRLAEAEEGQAAFAKMLDGAGGTGGM